MHMAFELAFSEMILPFLSKLPEKIISKVSKKFEKKSGKFIMVNEITIINLSGHELNDKSIARLNKMFGKVHLFSIPIEYIDIKNIEFASLEIVEKIILTIDNVRVLLTGEYLVIPPTYHLLTISVFAILNGLTGHFPNAIIMEKAESASHEFIPLNKILNLEDLRIAGRKIR